MPLLRKDDIDVSSATREEVFSAHEGGKLAISLPRPIDTQRDLSLVYTPGVAQVSQAIEADPSVAKTYTWSARLVAVISDGSSVLGLGNIGPRASLPVMEGKSALFKEFSGLDSVPIVLDTTEVDEIVDTVIRISPSFGAINLEDISAPRCFEVERRLVEALKIPVMHDDQHGTAVVVLAALINACKVVGKEFSGLKVVISGAGAAGVAVANILLGSGIENIVILDSRGIIHVEREDLSSVKRELAERTNPGHLRGGVSDAFKGADVCIGLSSSTFSEDDVASMNDRATVFALSNPDPEIHPDVARRYASVVATGRSDYPNQINNVLAFPGIFRGALDADARNITLGMKLAAAEAIAELVAEDLRSDYIVPSPLDARVAAAVAESVRREATEQIS